MNTAIFTVMSTNSVSMHQSYLLQENRELRETVVELRQEVDLLRQETKDRGQLAKDESMKEIRQLRNTITVLRLALESDQHTPDSMLTAHSERLDAAPRQTNEVPASTTTWEPHPPRSDLRPPRHTLEARCQSLDSDVVAELKETIVRLRDELDQAVARANDEIRSVNRDHVRRRLELQHTIHILRQRLEQTDEVKT